MNGFDFAVHALRISSNIFKFKLELIVSGERRTDSDSSNVCHNDNNNKGINDLLSCKFIFCSVFMVSHATPQKHIYPNPHTPYILSGLFSSFFRFVCNGDDDDVTWETSHETMCHAKLECGFVLVQIKRHRLRGS